MKSCHLRIMGQMFAGLIASLGIGFTPQPVTAKAEIQPQMAPSGPGLDLTQYRGKVIYVDFWASWCAPCHLSFAYMNALRRQYGEKDLAIITINVDRDPAAAAGFLNQVGGNLPVVYDPKGVLATRFGVATMPTSFLVGRDGRQRFVHRGYFDNQARDYTAHVAALVADHN